MPGYPPVARGRGVGSRSCHMGKMPPAQPSARAWQNIYLNQAVDVK